MDNEIYRKIDVTAILFLLVQNRQQTHHWTLIGSGANELGILEWYLRSMTLGCKYIGIRKLEFVTNTQFLCTKWGQWWRINKECLTDNAYTIHNPLNIPVQIIFQWNSCFGNKFSFLAKNIILKFKHKFCALNFFKGVKKFLPWCLIFNLQKMKSNMIKSYRVNVIFTICSCFCLVN